MRRSADSPVLLCLACPRRPAPTGGVTKLLRDACGDEQINGTYTQTEYTQGARPAADRLRRVHATAARCIQRARLAALGAGKHKSSGGGGSRARRRTAARAPRAAAASGTLEPPRRAQRRPAGHRHPASSARPWRRPRSPPSRSRSAASSCSRAPSASATLSGAGRDVPTPLIVAHLPARRRPRSARRRLVALESCPHTPLRLIPAPSRGRLRCRGSPPSRWRRVAFGAVLAAIALQGGGGLQLGPLTKVELGDRRRRGRAGRRGDRRGRPHAPAVGRASRSA